MAISLTPKKIAGTASQIGKAFEDARKAAKLGRVAAAAAIGVDPQTLYRWEKNGVVLRADVASVLRAEALYGVPLIPLLRECLGIDVPRGTSRGSPQGRTDAPGDLLPFARVLALPSVRERLNAIQRELIDASVSLEAEESVMRTIRDRQRIARFAGGSTDDSYTEAQVLLAIENIAEAARATLGLPPIAGKPL